MGMEKRQIIFFTTGVKVRRKRKEEALRGTGARKPAYITCP